jgi:hypothetical protein
MEETGWAVSRHLLGVSLKSAVPAIVVIHPLAKDILQGILHLIGNDTEYLIQEGAISRQMDNALRLRTFQDEPKNGSSISPINNNDSSNVWGSLGGYLNLNLGFPVAMTCGHLTLSQDSSETISWVQPAITHLNEALNQEGNSPTCSQSCSRTQSCSENCPYFGATEEINGKYPAKNTTKLVTVKISGHNPVPRELNICVDWAIVRNLLRTATENIINDTVIKECKQLEYSTNEKGELIVGRGEKVYMQGAASNQTQGLLESDLHLVRFPEADCDTQEVAIVREDGEPFSSGGDSGSWVIEKKEDKYGRVIGGVLIGVMIGGGETASYITPIEHLLDDITLTLDIEKPSASASEIFLDIRPAESTNFNTFFIFFIFIFIFYIYIFTTTVPSGSCNLLDYLL